MSDFVWRRRPLEEIEGEAAELLAAWYRRANRGGRPDIKGGEPEIERRAVALLQECVYHRHEMPRYLAALVIHIIGVKPITLSHAGHRRHSDADMHPTDSEPNFKLSDIQRLAAEIEATFGRSDTGGWITSATGQAIAEALKGKGHSISRKTVNRWRNHVADYRGQVKWMLEIDELSVEFKKALDADAQKTKRARMRRNQKRLEHKDV